MFIYIFFYLIHLKIFSFRLTLLCFRSKKTLNIAWDIIIGLNLALICGIDFHNYFYVFVIIIGRNKEERRQRKLIYYAKCAILSLFVFFREQLLLLSSYRWGNKFLNKIKKLARVIWLEIKRLAYNRRSICLS